MFCVVCGMVVLFLLVRGFAALRLFQAGRRILARNMETTWNLLNKWKSQETVLLLGPVLLLVVPWWARLERVFLEFSDCSPVFPMVFQGFTRMS